MQLEDGDLFIVTGWKEKEPPKLPDETALREGFVSMMIPMGALAQQPRPRDNPYDNLVFRALVVCDQCVAALVLFENLAQYRQERAQQTSMGLFTQPSPAPRPSIVGQRLSLDLTHFEVMTVTPAYALALGVSQNVLG